MSKKCLFCKLFSKNSRLLQFINKLWQNVSVKFIKTAKTIFESDKYKYANSKKEQKNGKLHRSERIVQRVQEVSWQWLVHWKARRNVLDIDFAYLKITELQPLSDPSQRRFKWARAWEIDEVSEDRKALSNVLADIQLCNTNSIQRILLWACSPLQIWEHKESCN